MKIRNFGSLIVAPLSLSVFLYNCGGGEQGEPSPETHVESKKQIITPSPVDPNQGAIDTFIESVDSKIQELAAIESTLTTSSNFEDLRNQVNGIKLSADSKIDKESAVTSKMQELDTKRNEVLAKIEEKEREKLKNEFITLAELNLSQLEAISSSLASDFKSVSSAADLVLVSNRLKNSAEDLKLSPDFKIKDNVLVKDKFIEINNKIVNIISMIAAERQKITTKFSDVEKKKFLEEEKVQIQLLKLEGEKTGYENRITLLVDSISAKSLKSEIQSTFTSVAGEDIKIKNKKVDIIVKLNGILKLKKNELENEEKRIEEEKEKEEKKKKQAKRDLKEKVLDLFNEFKAGENPNPIFNSIRQIKDIGQLKSLVDDFEKNTTKFGVAEAGIRAVLVEVDLKLKEEQKQANELEKKKKEDELAEKNKIKNSTKLDINGMINPLKQSINKLSPVMQGDKELITKMAELNKCSVQILSDELPVEVVKANAIKLVEDVNNRIAALKLNEQKNINKGNVVLQQIDAVFANRGQTKAVKEEKRAFYDNLMDSYQISKDKKAEVKDELVKIFNDEVRRAFFKKIGNIDAVKNTLNGDSYGKISKFFENKDILGAISLKSDEEVKAIVSRVLVLNSKEIGKLTVAELGL